jgi:hypothetical protein
MIELIIFIILILSLGGVFAILYKKAPKIATLPKSGRVGIKKHRIISELEEKFKSLHFDLFVKKLLLHKILSWIKVMTLKLEVKIDHLLHKIRKNAQKLDKPM